MSEIDQSSIIRLADELSNKILLSSIPLEIDLWGVKEIAAFLKVSSTQVRERYCCKPSFPKSIRLPTSRGIRRGHPRWKAKEIVAWAYQHIEGGNKCSGRKSNHTLEE